MLVFSTLSLSISNTVGADAVKENAPQVAAAAESFVDRIYKKYDEIKDENPSFQNKISIQTLLRFRVQQLLVPLLMGTLVYLVGTVTNLSILPPVCFVFVCLIVVTFRLKKSRWKINRFAAIEHSGQHSA